MHLVDQIKAKARTSLQTVVLPESYDDRMIQAAELITKDGLAKVVLLGDAAALETKAGELGVSLAGVDLINPKNAAQLDDYVAELVKLREKKGLSAEQAREILTGEDNLFFGAMMVRKEAFFPPGNRCDFLFTKCHKLRADSKLSTLKMKRNINNFRSLRRKN